MPITVARKRLSVDRTSAGKPKVKKWSRPRPLPPDVTARNLAIEKYRREELNDSFLV